MIVLVASERYLYTFCEQILLSQLSCCSCEEISVISMNDAVDLILEVHSLMK